MSTVLIENIHVQMQRTPAIARAVAEGAGETAVPLLLILLCILSVFIPAFIMAEPVHSLFVPLSISVGLAVITAYALSSTIVPVLSIWLLKPLGIGKPQRASRHDSTAEFHAASLHQRLRRRGRPRLLPSVSRPQRRFHLVATSSTC